MSALAQLIRQPAKSFQPFTIYPYVDAYGDHLLTSNNVAFINSLIIS